MGCCGGLSAAFHHTAAERHHPTTEETTIPIDRPASDTRSSCNGKPVQALAIFYKPNAGYTGADNVVVDVDFHVGGVRRFAYKITVR